MRPEVAMTQTVEAIIDAAGHVQLLGEIHATGVSCGYHFHGVAGVGPEELMSGEASAL
jgi:hypothetical protein